jgi:hypothetical protein
MVDDEPQLQPPLPASGEEVFDDTPRAVESPSGEISTLTVPSRTLPLFLILFAAGLIPLFFAYFTVFRGTGEVLATNPNALRAHFSITHWLEHGYFRSGGLAFRPNADTGFIYKSSTGGVLLGGFVVEKVYSSVTGHYSWRLLALYNQLFSLLTSTMVALLGCRIARRIGARPAQALAIAVATQAVHFTFPDNLMLYWEMSGRECWLFFAAIFLLLEDRSVESRTMNTTIAQGVAIFFLTYMEYIAGLAFVASYLVTKLALAKERDLLRRLAAICILPAALALTVYAGQLTWAFSKYPDVPKEGSSFLFRSGLDGSAKHYIGHLDIAFRRDLARANWNNRPYLFRWQWLFLAGTASLVATVIAAMRGRVPHLAIVTLLSLLGAYLLYAAVFSQAVVIHPYLYDLMLYTPLVLALLVVVPSMIEAATDRRGLAVVIVFFLAVWISMVQLRDYALLYPPPAAVSEAMLGAGSRQDPAGELHPRFPGTSAGSPDRRSKPVLVTAMRVLFQPFRVYFWTGAQSG